MGILLSLLLSLISVGCYAASVAEVNDVKPPVSPVPTLGGSGKSTEGVVDKTGTSPTSLVGTLKEDEESTVATLVAEEPPSATFPTPPKTMTMDQRLVFLAEQNHPISRYVGLIEHHNPILWGCIPLKWFGYGQLFGASAVFVRTHAGHGICYTAAHVFDPFTSKAGKVDLSHAVTVKIEGKRYLVKEIHIHPDYAPKREVKEAYLDDDIALLILDPEQQVPLPPLALSTEIAEDHYQERVLEVGFGHSYEDDACGFKWGRNDKIQRAQETRRCIYRLPSGKKSPGHSELFTIIPEEGKEHEIPDYPMYSHYGMSGGGYFSGKGELIAISSSHNGDYKKKESGKRCIPWSIEGGLDKYFMGLGMPFPILTDHSGPRELHEGKGANYYHQSEWAQAIFKSLEGK
jgi:hypothetical protein